MHLLGLVSLLALFLLSNATAVLAQNVAMPSELRPVRDYIETSIRNGVSPSLALAVVRDGRVVWAEGFGQSDLERGIAATADTAYWLASVSKPITATGLMKLVEEGKIDLDRPVNAYLPGAKLKAYAGSADEMTVRRLANHTAGMPVHYNFYYPGTKPLSYDEAIGRYGFAASAPGTRWVYSNLAFGILEYITELVSGTPWGRYMEENVYRPLKMTRTSDGAQPGQGYESAVPYRKDAAGRFTIVERYDFDHRGASAVWSTPNDLARFVLMHMNGGELDGVRVLKPESVLSMQTLSSESQPGVGTGIGWAVGPYLGHQCFSHSGGMPGVSTMVRVFPRQKAATIVLTNSDDRTMAGEVTSRIVRAMLGGNAPQASRARGADQGKGLALVGTWEGRVVHFDGDVPLRFVVNEDGTVEAVLDGHAPTPMRDIRLTDTSLNGRVPALLMTQDGFRGVPDLVFNLQLDGNRLSGVGVLQAAGWFALSHWVELVRKLPTTEQ
jgi:CubicO group peptidase (beta-lactamase class C family)